MCNSKCNGQVNLDITLRSLEFYQRRLRSQHPFSWKWPPKCSSNVFPGIVCFFSPSLLLFIYFNLINYFFFCLQLFIWTQCVLVLMPLKIIEDAFSLPTGCLFSSVFQGKLNTGRSHSAVSKAVQAINSDQISVHNIR